MGGRLQEVIAKLSGAECVELAVAVREELEEGVPNEIAAGLTPAAAARLADQLAEIEPRFETAADEELPAVAREFLDALVEAEAFDKLIAECLLDAGVRLGGRVSAGRLRRPFRLGALIGGPEEAAPEPPPEVERRRGVPQPAERERSAPPPESADDPWGLPREHQLWFGTNRAPVDAADLARGFTNERDPDGEVHYGTCAVSIPKTHKFGSIGTPFWKRWRRLEFADDSLELRRIVPFGSGEEFLSSLLEEMAGRDEDERTLLVYLHGYNTSFEEAAVRAAQIGFDLKVETTAFYSWPSKREVEDYLPDIARIEASERQIAEFLTALATRAGAARVHVIAHSMGNRGFARAVARITRHASETSDVRFGQIILAAPDLDVDLFKELAAVYPKISERTTLYASAKDRALRLSSFLQDSDRAGFTPPVTVLDGIDTVEVTDIDLDLLGHGYFAEAESVLYDMMQLLTSSTPPDKRARTRARQTAAGKYWSIGA